MNIEMSSELERRAGVHRALGEPHRLAIVDALRLSDRSPSELSSVTGLGSNLVAFHLDVLEEAGIVSRHRSEGDARRRYVTLRPDALEALHPGATVSADTVLFVCTQNSARSQLAAALWTRRTGRRAMSAGTEPAERVHPLAVAVAAEHGLDLSGARPRHYAEVALDPDLVVSVCDRAREARGSWPTRHVHWSIADPVRGGPARFERALGELEVRIEHLARATAGSGA